MSAVEAKNLDLADVHLLEGAESVRECIEAAQPVESPKETDEEALQRLSKLSSLEYDKVRGAEADKLGVRASTLDQQVKALRKKSDKTDGIDLEDIDPWPDPVNADELLSEIAATIRRFIICPVETVHAAALWIAMTWFMDVVQVAPLAVITAPEKRCGKSQLLFLLGKLVCRPLGSSNISPAALFRAVDAWKPTLLVDEADSFMRDNEELRGLLNCGHTRDSAYIVRVVGDDHTPKRFNVWGAKALAGIGHLADTIMDRAIVLELRRKLNHENSERLRYAEPDLFEKLAAKLSRMATDNRDAIRLCRPSLPPQLNDRAQDNWEPLLAIADVAGGQWPTLARSAALRLSGSGEDSATIGSELLSDIREVLETKRVDRISTTDLINELCADDEKLWATYNRGKPVTPKQIANRLKAYDIKSKTIRIGYDTAKGFEAEQFADAFSRYLAATPELPVTPSQPIHGGAFAVTDAESVTVTDTLSVTPKPLQHKGCYLVTDKSVEAGQNEMIEVEV